jgi:hypothetical protein
MGREGERIVDPDCSHIEAFPSTLLWIANGMRCLNTMTLTARATDWNSLKSLCTAVDLIMPRSRELPSS